MLRCKLIDFLFFVFPLKVWRSFLIEHHIQKCPACCRKLAGLEKIRSLLIRESDVEDPEGLWPAVKARIMEKERKEQRIFWPRLRWIAGVSSLAVVIVAGIWLYLAFFQSRGPSEEILIERFQINYIRVENRPAKAFLFQPHGSDMIIVWAEKNS